MKHYIQVSLSLRIQKYLPLIKCDDVHLSQEITVINIDSVQEVRGGIFLRTFFPLLSLCLASTYL